MAIRLKSRRVREASGLRRPRQERALGPSRRILQQERVRKLNIIEMLFFLRRRRRSLIDKGGTFVGGGGKEEGSSMSFPFPLGLEGTGS